MENKKRNLILQVDVKLDNQPSGFKRFQPNRDMYDLSEYQAKKYANIWGADYYKIEDLSYLPDKHPTYQRFKMFEMLEYDNILYLDMDAIIMPVCPNPFPIFEKFVFSAVRNHDWDNMNDKNIAYMKSSSEKYGTENYKSFCAGVMFLTKEFLIEVGDNWRKYLYTFDKGEHDQDMINQLVVDHYGGKYNDMMPEWGAWFRNGKYIDHMGSKLRKLDFEIGKYTKKKNIEYNLGNDDLSKFM